MSKIYILVPDYGREGYGKPESAHASLESAEAAKAALSITVEIIEFAAPQPQPIETAPRDGKRILIFTPDGPADEITEPGERGADWHSGWHAGRFEAGINQWVCGGELWFDEAFHLEADEPTHWMPVPPDPKER